jgi:hypothetical protein
MNVVLRARARPDPERGSTMKRNPRNRNRFQIKPLKITVSDAEIMADLRHGVDGQTRHPGNGRREITHR